MKRLVLIFIILLVIPQVGLSADDKVIKVYSCGDDIGIQIENRGHFVILQSEVGEKRVDRMYSMAMSLIATQLPIGYINDNKPAIHWCGISDVKPITVMQILRK